MGNQIIGYARVSSSGQSVAVQKEILEANGATTVKTEKASGRSRADRHKLNEVLEWIEEGDTLMVTRMDRLARSVSDLHNIVGELNKKGAHLRVTEQDIDTTTPQGRLMFSMLGAIAEFENDLRKDRQAEGIAKAKAEGRFNGRPVTIDHEAIRRARDEGMKPAQIAKEFGIARSSVYRAIAEK
ncbi:recombinase family protein [Aliiroseovarius crassostreae]|uniref:recombinase family protein n=1 Tax=Aliiroseovarius crassostreae TaxID=154981 RepID=UPI0022022819|nr:recombinase family protein [Aliiroseovarius crassostreae]UWP99463.1 recombinase family protein [Aliiroseovarius crassostreae]